MNKGIIIFCTVLASCSLTAFGYMNWNNTVANKKERKEADIDLGYKVNSRFETTITKANLHKATSVLDIVPKKAEGWWKVSFQTITVALLQDGEETRAIGYEKALNADQIELLQSADYSTNFYIKARGKYKHAETGQIEDYVYHFTIIPEQEARYTGGYDALYSYLRENNKKEAASIQQDQLERGMISFTVTKEGAIANVKLLSTSGYPSVDNTLVELITAMPGKWNPATNSKGEKVDQILVVSFGNQSGC